MSNRRPTARMVRTTLLLLLVLAVAVPAFASDRFSDVPSGAVYHDATSRLADAGIAEGCTEDRFCPDAALRRRQMALFLDRMAGRSVSASSAGAFAPADGGGLGATPVTVAASAGGVPGGSGRMTLHGNVTVHADGDLSGCPCEVEAFVYRIGDNAKGPASWAILPADGPDGPAVTVPVNWGVAFGSGSSADFGIGVFINSATPAGVEAQGALTAVWTPYG